MTNKEIIKFGKHYVKKRKFDSMKKLLMEMMLILITY